MELGDFDLLQRVNDVLLKGRAFFTNARTPFYENAYVPPDMAVEHACQGSAIRRIPEANIWFGTSPTKSH